METKNGNERIKEGRKEGRIWTFTQNIIKHFNDLRNKYELYTLNLFMKKNSCCYLSPIFSKNVYGITKGNALSSIAQNGFFINKLLI